MRQKQGQIEWTNARPLPPNRASVALVAPPSDTRRIGVGARGRISQKARKRQQSRLDLGQDQVKSGSISGSRRRSVD